jgi:N-acetylmuramoyl-L-alanine amidase
MSTPAPAYTLSEQAIDDIFMLTLCCWREDRSGKGTGMTAVAWAVRNRYDRDKTSYYAEVTARLQFSSVTAPRDPELDEWAKKGDPMWALAREIARGVIYGPITDPTGGATLYYAETIPFPAAWNRSKVEQTITAGGQIFFRELT